MRRRVSTELEVSASSDDEILSLLGDMDVDTVKTVWGDQLRVPTDYRKNRGVLEGRDAAHLALDRPQMTVVQELQEAERLRQIRKENEYEEGNRSLKPPKSMPQRRMVPPLPRAKPPREKKKLNLNDAVASCSDALPNKGVLQHLQRASASSHTDKETAVSESVTVSGSACESFEVADPDRMSPVFQDKHEIWSENQETGTQETGTQETGRQET
eukprot:Platyproteum_vivax@DN4876_c1_g1_i1.p1